MFVCFELWKELFTLPSSSSSHFLIFFQPETCVTILVPNNYYMINATLTIENKNHWPSYRAQNLTIVVVYILWAHPGHTPGTPTCLYVFLLFLLYVIGGLSNGCPLGEKPKKTTKIPMKTAFELHCHQGSILHRSWLQLSLTKFHHLTFDLWLECATGCNFFKEQSNSLSVSYWEW